MQPSWRKSFWPSFAELSCVYWRATCKPCRRISTLLRTSCHFSLPTIFYVNNLILGVEWPGNFLKPGGKIWSFLFAYVMIIEDLTSRIHTNFNNEETSWNNMTPAYLRFNFDRHKKSQNRVEWSKVKQQHFGLNLLLQKFCKCKYVSWESPSQQVIIFWRGHKRIIHRFD